MLRGQFNNSIATTNNQNITNFHPEIFSPNIMSSASKSLGLSSPIKRNDIMKGTSGGARIKVAVRVRPFLP